MPFPNVTLPQFPNVPNLPGVPALARDPFAVGITLAAPLISGFLGSFMPTWGIFDSSGNKALNPDTFIGIEYDNPFRVSIYPVEQGSFANYNKVKTPFSGTVRMAIGGPLQNRQQFMASLESMVADTNLYTLVTPEATYANVNLERYEYRREETSSANLIVARCRFVEIRQAMTSYGGITSVPSDYLTNPSTSTGLINGQSVANPSSALSLNYGSITTTPLAPTPSFSGTTVLNPGSYTPG